MNHSPPPELTDDEVKRATRPLKQPAAQARFLKRLGVHVRRRPDGTLLVGRAQYEAILGTAPR